MKNNHFYSEYIFEKFKLKETLATTIDIDPLLKVQTGEKRRPKPHKIRFVSGCLLFTKRVWTVWSSL